MAPQSTATKGPAFLLLLLCIAWANISFPVPLSPVIMTLLSKADAFFATVIASLKASDSPMRSSNVYFAANRILLAIISIVLICVNLISLPPGLFSNPLLTSSVETIHLYESFFPIRSTCPPVLAFFSSAKNSASEGCVTMVS